LTALLSSIEQLLFHKVSAATEMAIPVVPKWELIRGETYNASTWQPFVILPALPSGIYATHALHLALLCGDEQCAMLVRESWPSGVAVWRRLGGHVSQIPEESKDKRELDEAPRLYDDTGRFNPQHLKWVNNGMDVQAQDVANILIQRLSANCGKRVSRVLDAISRILAVTLSCSFARSDACIISCLDVGGNELAVLSVSQTILFSHFLTLLAAKLEVNTSQLRIFLPDGRLIHSCWNTPCIDLFRADN